MDVAGLVLDVLNICAEICKRWEEAKALKTEMLPFKNFVAAVDLVVRDQTQANISITVLGRSTEPQQTAYSA